MRLHERVHLKISCKIYFHTVIGIKKDTPMELSLLTAATGLDEIKVWLPSSRKPATVHRTVAFRLFESGPLPIKKTPRWGYPF